MSHTPDEAVGGAPVEAPRRPARWLVALVLLGLTALAYRPVWHAGFVWDDHGHVTRGDLRSVQGLVRIWTEPGATQQYYPLLHSAFWIEHRLWGDAALGYHLANVGLHAVAAFLFFLLLRRLGVPGALLAASVFAVHPVCVESVAWVSEQKNTLSAVLYFAAALAYLRFDGGRRASWYALGTLLFVMAVATKSVTATLPAALLVVLWWRRGSLSLRRDGLPLLPWFVIAALAGILTAWVERTLVGARGAAFAMGPVDRVLLAGRALWFYLVKVLWPERLMFIYPRWRIDPHAAWQWLFPLAALLVVAVAFGLRRRTRGPLAAALLFIGTLFPALGFVNVYPFIYSFVADHFQYLAVPVVLAAFAGALTLGARRLPKAGQIAATAAACATLAFLALLTTRECRAYTDAETLWKATLALNPDCWMARQNLGGVYLGEGRVDEADQQFRAALEINPEDTDALNDHGVALMRLGQPEAAIAEFRRALALAPGDPETHINLGAVFLQEHEGAPAAAEFRRALELQPGSSKARRDLAAAYGQEGRLDEAVAELVRAERIEPGNATIEFDLANALLSAGRTPEAILHFKASIEADPDVPEVHNNLGTALLRTGAAQAAAAEFRRSLELDDGYADAQFNLASMLLQAGRTDEALPHLRKAAALRPESAEAQAVLAAALLQAGQAVEAVGHYQRALELDPGNAQLHNDLGSALVRAGRSDEAFGQFQRAVELKPDLAAGHAGLGNYWLQHRRPAQAAEDYARAIALEPNNARVRNNLGIALIALGRPEEAAAQFRSALAIDPAYADARRNLERVTERSGR